MHAISRQWRHFTGMVQSRILVEVEGRKEALDRITTLSLSRTKRGFLTG